MAIAKGTAIGANEISCLAIGSNEVLSLAIGGVQIYEKGADILGVVSAPRDGIVSTPLEITVLCNRQTDYVVTYTINGQDLIGLGRTVKTKVDLPNNQREITLEISFGTAGERNVRMFGSTVSGVNAAQHLSLSYIDIPIRINRG